MTERACVSPMLHRLSRTFAVTVIQFEVVFLTLSFNVLNSVWSITLSLTIITDNVFFKTAKMQCIFAQTKIVEPYLQFLSLEL